MDSLLALFSQIMNFIDDNPISLIIAGVVMIVIAVMIQRQNNSTAGTIGLLTVAVILFILGLSKLTGLSIIPFV